MRNTLWLLIQICFNVIWVLEASLNTENKLRVQSLEKNLRQKDQNLKQNIYQEKKAKADGKMKGRLNKKHQSDKKNSGNNQR